MPNPNVDLLELLIEGRYAGRLASRETGISHPILSGIKSGRMVPLPQHLQAFAKWSGKPRKEVAARFARLIRERVDQMVGTGK